MPSDHPFLRPNSENANDMLPLLSESGKCNYCGFRPEVVLDDPRTADEFPTGHAHVCKGLARGITDEMTSVDVRMKFAPHTITKDGKRETAKTS